MNGHLNLETGEWVQREDRPRRRTRVEVRLQRLFERVGEALENRGDEELGGAVRAEARAMSSGLVSATRRTQRLRSLLLTLLDVVEPALAFGRVLAIVLRRLASRRARMMVQRGSDEPSELVGSFRGQEVRP
jgi:hypothetical protein